MQRKSAYPSTTSNIKLVDYGHTDEDDVEQQQHRQQLINFGHATWGFNNWNWTVTKQELDFVDFANGKYCAGVVAYVSISIKSFDIHRENIGYATAFATSKGFAIYKCRKNAVTNALRETLLSFGGNVACELEAMEAREQAEEHNGPAPAPALGPGPPHGPAPPPHVPAPPPHVPAPSPHGPAPLPHVPAPPPHVPAPSPHVPIVPHAAAPPALASAPPPAPVSAPAPAPISTPAPIKQELKPLCAPRMENGRAAAAPVAKAHPMPASMPRGVPPLRPNSNVSFVVPMMPPLYAPPRLPPPHVFPNYYEYPWHFSYESFDRHHGNVNLNFNIPPKSLVVNSRGASVECKSQCRPDGEFGAPQGCWVKPTIFYDGFWTEQKVKKWVAEQVEKQFPEERAHESPSPRQDAKS